MSSSIGSSSDRRHRKTREEVIRNNEATMRKVNIAITMIWMAVAVFVVYAVHRFFPFLKSISFYHKINVSSITYILLRIFSFLIPLGLVFPSEWYSRYIRKTRLISDFYSIVSFLYFFGMVADVFSYNLLGGYVDDGSDPILMKLLWNVTDKSGVVYCFLMGLLNLMMSKKLEGHKKDVVILQALIFTVYCIVPIVASVISGEIFSEAWYTWFGKNIYIFIYNLFLLLGYAISATARYIWGRVIYR